MCMCSLHSVLAILPLFKTKSPVGIYAKLSSFRLPISIVTFMLIQLSRFEIHKTELCFEHFILIQIAHITYLIQCSMAIFIVQCNDIQNKSQAFHTFRLRFWKKNSGIVIQPEEVGVRGHLIKMETILRCFFIVCLVRGRKCHTALRWLLNFINASGNGYCCCCCSCCHCCCVSRQKREKIANFYLSIAMHVNVDKTVASITISEFDCIRSHIVA